MIVLTETAPPHDAGELIRGAGDGLQALDKIWRSTKSDAERSVRISPETLSTTALPRRE